MSESSDANLLKLILEADDQALSEGVPPKGRGLVVLPKVMERLGYRNVIMLGANAPPVAKRILALHSSLYRPADLAMGGIHGGIFMFRDVFVRISVPIVYGRALIEPLTLTDLSDMQLRWLQSRPNDYEAFHRAFIDVFDFGGGIANFGEFKQPPKDAKDIFQLAAFQFQAAAATLSVAYHFGGAVQSALIGAELALKGALAAFGLNEAQRRQFGHNMSDAANALKEKKPSFDNSKVQAAISTLPHFVQNRYAVDQPSRTETGNIVMGCQFVAGEAMRAVTEFSISTWTNRPAPRSGA